MVRSLCVLVRAVSWWNAFTPAETAWTGNCQKAPARSTPATRCGPRCAAVLTSSGFVERAAPFNPARQHRTRTAPALPLDTHAPAGAGCLGRVAGGGIVEPAGTARVRERGERERARERVAREGRAPQRSEERSRLGRFEVRSCRAGLKGASVSA